jgi:hypothetical protein
MGCRLHSAKKYVVQWGTSSYFNWCQSDISHLFGLFGMYCDDKDFDVDIDDYKYMLKSLKEMSDEEFDEHMSPFNYSREETIDNLQSLYDQADKSDGCIYFSWF